MDGFKVFRLDAIPSNIGIRLAPNRDISHEVLDKDRVSVGALGNRLFIGALKKAVELRAGGVFDEADHVFDPHGFPETNRKRYVAALIMGAGAADRFRARAERGDRHDDLHEEVHFSAFERRLEFRRVV